MRHKELIVFKLYLNFTVLSRSVTIVVGIVQVCVYMHVNRLVASQV